MRVTRKVAAIGGAAAVIAAGGVGIAYAVGGDSEEQVTGRAAEKAKRAALESVGGGTVSEIERQDGDGGGAFEVEVKRDDGSQVEVHVDRNFNVVGQAGDDDGAGDGEGPGDDE